MAILNVLNLGITGSILGIIGILTGYYFYRKSTIGPRLHYQMATLRVFGNESEMFKEDELQISFLGKKVDRITKTQIVIWNSGTSMINGSDVVANDNVRLEFSDSADVLKVSILSISRQVNNFRMEIDSNKNNVVDLDFDFLDPKDGAIIELLHTDSKHYPVLNGTIKGIPTGFRYRGTVNYPLGQRLTKKDNILSYITDLGPAVIMLVLTFFMFIDPLISHTENINWPTIILVILIISVVIMRIMKFFKKRFPRSLNDNYSD